MAHTNGSEPINFRATLAAFESNTATSSSSSSSSSSSGAILRSPKPRPIPPPARSSSDTSDPVPRSSSAPRIRKTSENRLLSPSSANNPFMPNTSASGMLNPPIPSSVSPRFAPTTLKKSGSGLSLKQLANRSLPPNGASVSPSPLVPSCSTSVAEQQRDGEVGSSGRSSPQGLFADKSWNTTESPAETANELDTSADDAMFAHALMDRSSSPPSSLVPPQVPSRKGSESCTHSTWSSTPKLPPRPGGGNLAPSPTISEFGQFSSATTSKGKSGVGYATYTPGVKRIAAAANGGGGGESGGGREGGMTPPALPPRSATLGGERARLAAPEPYRTRQKSPSKPSAPIVPRKPISAGGAGASRPAPPPRPTKPAGSTTWEGSAGGFKFGSSSSSTTTANDASSAPPISHHRRGNSTSTTTHRKTGSTVFTSISLSDDASSELKRSLESDLDSDHPPSQQGVVQRMPPRRQPRPPCSSSTFRSPATSQSGVVGVASSLIGTAASALPLFKPASGSAGGGKLADGAPSKQFGGVGVSRSASTHSELTIRPRDGQGELWSSAGRVQLAETSVVRVRSVIKEPKDHGDKERYEALFTKLINPQRNSTQSKQGQTNREEIRGWFESDPSPSLSSNTIPPTCETVILSPRTVRKVWNKSKLSPSFLALVYDQLSPSTAQNGLNKKEFVKGMASIDSELERRKAKRESKREVRAKRTGMGRRVPPPPPPPPPPPTNAIM